MNNYTCLNCQALYTNNNPPLKLKNCNHRLCQHCIQINNNCPIDGTLIDCKKSDKFIDLNQFPIDSQLLSKALKSKPQNKYKTISSNYSSNLNVLKSMPNISIPSNYIQFKQNQSPQMYNKKSKAQNEKQNQYEQFQQCLLHFKPADLICLDDNQLICPSCALFGSHKGHSIQSQQNFIKKLKDISIRAEQYYERLKAKKEGQLSKHTFQGFCKQKAISKRNKMTEQIKNRFSNIIKSLKQVEKQCLLKVQSTYKQNIQSFKSIQMFQNEFDQEMKLWLNNVIKLRQFSEEKIKLVGNNLAEGIKFLKQDLYIVKKGQILYTKLIERQEKIKKQVEDLVNKASIQFLPDFQENAKICCSIIFKKEEEQQQNVVQCDFDDVNSSLTLVGCVSSENTLLQMLYPSEQSQNKRQLINPKLELNQKMIESVVTQPIKIFSNLQNNKLIKQSQEDQFLLSLENFGQPFKFGLPKEKKKEYFIESSLNQFVSSDFLAPKDQNSIIKDKVHMQRQKSNKQNLMLDPTPRKSLQVKKIFQNGLLNNFQESNQKRFSLNMNEKRSFTQITGPLQQSPHISLQRNILKDKTYQVNNNQDKSKSKSKIRDMRSPSNRSSFSLSSSHSSISLSNQKTKKLKLPQKYKNIIDDLQNDRCQVIDLSGAQLGDQIILNLCDFVKRSQKLKILKLIRNKITDDIFQVVVKSCLNEGSKITSLNLSQNLLSQRCVDIIQGIQLKNLKNITLSMNKINRRSVKQIIDEYEKEGVKLTI